MIEKLSKPFYIEDCDGFTDKEVVNKVNELVDYVNYSNRILVQALSENTKELVKEIERLKVKNEQIRQNSISHETFMTLMNERINNG